MANDDVTTNEIMDFLRKEMMTREEIKTFVDDRLSTTESRILSEVDRFVKLHETLDTEMLALRSRCERMEDRLEIVERKLGLATY